MVGSYHTPLMRRNYHEVHSCLWSPAPRVQAGLFVVPPRPPTEEERERMRRMAEAYDEAESERVLRLAFPSPPPESS